MQNLLLKTKNEKETRKAQNQQTSASTVQKKCLIFSLNLLNITSQNARNLRFMQRSEDMQNFAICHIL